MPNRLSHGVYRAVRGLVWLFYPRPRLEGLEHLPEGPCVIVGNHAQMNGPIVAELYVPGDREIWCAGEMTRLREVPPYAYRDFWSRKPGTVRWFFRLLSYVIAPLAVCVFNNAHCIPVDRGPGIVGTFRRTLKRLQEGARVVIFPETDPPQNAILYTLQDGFIDLGRMFAHRTGQPLAFVPMYVAPALRRVVFGPPIAYDPFAAPEAERARVSGALTEAITSLARALPRHRVVPYRNIPRRDYPMNLPEEVTDR